MKNFLFYTVICFLFVSCKKEPVSVNPAFGKSFYPVQVGHTLLYDVTEIRWSGFQNGKSDTTHYQLKEYIESFFLNFDGDTIYRIERSVRDNAADNWEIKNVWQLIASPAFVDRVEENLRYRKLLFPLRANSTWNANTMIDSFVYYQYHYYDPVIQDVGIIYQDVKNARTKVENFDQPYTIGNRQYPNTVSFVLHDWTASIISSDYEKEVYADKIGLIYKLQYHIENKFNSSAGVYLPHNGYRKEMRLAN